jgi:Kef-type K+ transport system membrane component KefB
MGDLSSEIVLIILCSIVILSYLFSIVSRFIRVPAVILLLATGIALRYFADQQNWNFLMPRMVVEFLGSLGLIMIVLEAGLDLKLGKDKIGLSRDGFFSAFFIFLLSTCGITFILVYFIEEPIHNCIVYAIPLSIMSSAIVIPSLHQLLEHKKEFLIYEAGKLLHLPSLIIIIIFGLMMNNWNLIRIPKIQKMFPKEKVQETTHLLHGITAETSFLIRTFFFIAFGFSINIQSVFDHKVILIGSIIVLILLVFRYLYLRFFLKESVYPEVVFIPPGLVTVLLFYKIPELYRLKSFNEGILYFVVLITSLVMMLGMLFYKKKPEELVEESLLYTCL